MSKRIGLFTDLHGDRQNLELILRTFRRLGVDSTLFLGDAIFKTMADFTRELHSKAYQTINELYQETPLRQDVLDGLYSDEQLEAILKSSQLGINVGKKVAKAQYQDLRTELSEFETAILGGNWDYREEIQEVFGDLFLNGTAKQVGGVNFLGFSGGGSPALYTAMSETFADDKHRHGTQIEIWARALRANGDLDANVLISHVPFTDGENVEKENSVEHLKELVKRRRQTRTAQGLEDDLPNCYMWGHRHMSGDVQYNEELKGFTVLPGCSSRNHNGAVPSFMISEFDADNNLIGVDKFEIYCSLTGRGEVHLVGHYDIDQDGKKVDYVERDEVIIKDVPLQEYTDHLSLDENINLTQAGLNTNYDLFRDNPAELDLVIRKNILAMFEHLEDVTKKTTTALSDLGRDYFSNPDNIFSGNDLLAEAVDELAKIAGETFGCNYEAIAGSQHAQSIKLGLISAVLGISYEQLVKLRSKEITSIDDFLGKVEEITKGGNDTLSRQYQQSIFDDLESTDFQAMAEVHLPACYERTKELEQAGAWKLWLASYQKGLIGSMEVEESGAYKKKDDYIPNKKTKEELAVMFGFPTVEPVEASQRPPSRERNQADYDHRISEAIRSGEIDIIERDGQHYIVTDPVRGAIEPLDRERFNLSPTDYTAMSEIDYVQQQRDQLLQNRMNQTGNELPIQAPDPGI